MIDPFGNWQQLGTFIFLGTECLLKFLSRQKVEIKYN